MQAAGSAAVAEGWEMLGHSALEVGAILADDAETQEDS
jgi:hypothetical protein